MPLRVCLFSAVVLELKFMLPASPTPISAPGRGHGFPRHRLKNQACSLVLPLLHYRHKLKTDSQRITSTQCAP